ncbi:hypothetical protein [Acidocella sp.]|uniref:hypothetical protein n=1 Tax=Acidocella sp. TaxID=50710 RepID=UPI002628552D|nr:hypothetical protein [Acidocella sp.]
MRDTQPAETDLAAFSAALRARAPLSNKADKGATWLLHLAVRLAGAPMRRFAPGGTGGKISTPPRRLTSPDAPAPSPAAPKQATRSAAPANPSAAHTGAGSAVSVTGFRAVLAAAKTQAAKARAVREDRAGKHTAALQRASTGITRSFAPRSTPVRAHAPSPQAPNPASGPQAVFRPRPLLSAPVPVARDEPPSPPPSLPMATPVSSAVPSSAGLASSQPALAARYQQDIAFEQALDEYFLRLSRMPPAAAAAFDPRLSPRWVGLNLPG